MALTFRDVKGAKLSSAEGDANVRTLDARIAALELSPPTAVSIDHFVVAGTLLTIYMTNGSSHGPFVLPQAQWRWTDEWVAGVTYLPGDIFTNEGNVYFVRVLHVSAAPFDPLLFTEDGFVYIKILSKAAQRYDVGMFFIDEIGEGGDNAEILFVHVAAETLTLYPSFLHSQAFLRVATSVSSIALPIYWNTDTTRIIIGFINFVPGELTTSDGGQHGTFEVNDEYLPLVVAPGDRLSIAQPYFGDDSAAGLAVTIAALTPSA